MPKKSEILYSDLPKKQQKWKREPLPDYYKELRPEEERIQKEELKLVEMGELDKVYHFNPVLEAYRREQWRKRKYGVWIMVNGKPVYLTGAWWYYLQWCKFDHAENNGYPLFYMSQRKRFYFRQSAYEDPTSLGYVIIGARGFGKTTEETAVILESMTRGPKRRIAALQSKTGDDAHLVIFKGKFAPAYKSLPHFFKPESNHGTNPENKLNFFADSKKGQKAKDSKLDLEEHELENTIYHVSAKEKALDGQTMAEIFQDEIGKTDPKKEADVYKRMQVNRFSVFRNNRKVGMIRATTTVEEMDKGGDQCKKIWDDSDQLNRTDNGFTISGLYRLSISCLETSTQFADEFGEIDEDKAYKYQMAEREIRKHDSQALSSWIRKNPIDEEEMFIKDASKSLFNVFILTQRLHELHSMKRLPYVRGNFYWVDGKVDGLVDFKIDEHAGRFLVAKLLDVKLKPGDAKPGELLANQMSFYTDTTGKKQWMPKNDKYFRMGSDPIKYAKTKDPRASKFAMHGWEMYNPSVDHNKETAEWESHNFIFEYIDRPEDPATAYEDCIMAMRYYGCSMLPETNIKELAKHLKDRGYNECVIYRRDFDDDFLNGAQDDAGITSNTDVIHSYVTRLISFINKHGHRFKFPRTIEALLDFEAENTTKYDAVVSAGYTLFASEAPLDLEVEVEDIDDWFDEYDNSGSHSQLID
jgi:hypothetical protein